MKVIQLYKAYECLSNSYSDELPKEQKKTLKELMRAMRRTIDKTIKSEQAKPKLTLIKG